MKQLKKAIASMLALTLAACTENVSSAAPAESSVVVETSDTTVSLVEEFKDPSDSYKPLTRWWVPGSMMDKEEITKEIKSMAQAGLGGVEIVPVSVAGGDGEGQLDWGSDQWKEVTKHILEEAGKNNMTVDFTMTPAWPLALPTITDVNDPKQGAQMELDGAYVDGITASQPFHGNLPVSQEAIDDASKVNGKVVLVGATAAKYVDKENSVLSYDSAVVLETVDNGDGTYSAEFVPEDDGEYFIYAFYQHPSGNQKYENNQVDHYAKAGSQMIIDYWENELIPYYGDAFKNCRSMFIDSLEFETHLDWTLGLQESFEETNGYDITAYLPAVYDASDEWTAIGNYMGDPVPSFSFDVNTNEIVNDFKEHLTQLYIENNIKPLSAFCQKHGLTLRYQTSYGKSLDVAETAMYPDIPETESLYGNDYMDFYRLQAGAVHAMDKEIYSMETSAEWTETWNPKKDDGNYGTRGNGELNSGNYEQTFLDHIWHDQRAFATGVNQIVFHGYPYNGNYDGDVVEGTQWPGFTGFESYRWSNSWGERQPNWMFAKTYMDFIARNQYILRQGTPKSDVAVYHHSYYETIDFWGPDKILTTEALEQNGYSYDFVDPSALSKENMTVEEGILDPEGTAYKALVFDHATDIPYAVATRLNEYADNGLKIVFIGEVPTEKSFVKDEDIALEMEKLLASENVTVIETIDDIVKTLKNLGVAPDASYDNETLLATHRSDEENEYYFIYNYGGTNTYREIGDAKAVDANITLKGNGTPYIFNAWTGEVSLPEDFQKNDGTVTLSLHLEPNDSIIVVVSENTLDKANDSVEGIADDIVVEGWNLSIESWTMGETVLDTEKTIIDVGKLSELKTWNELDETLADISGIGTYTATFTLSDGYQTGETAYIHMGRVKDAYGVKINGEEVIVDQVSGDANITDLLKEGDNDIEVTIASSLLNAILKNNSTILNDDGRVLDDRNPAAYGLFNEVTINANPYR